MIEEKQVTTTARRFVCDVCGHASTWKTSRVGQNAAEWESRTHDCTTHRVRHDGNNWMHTLNWWTCSCGRSFETPIEQVGTPECPNASME